MTMVDRCLLPGAPPVDQPCNFARAANHRRGVSKQPDNSRQSAFQDTGKTKLPILDGGGAHAQNAYINDAESRLIEGREVVVAITDGKLDFGPWEQIFYAEFDGRRKKRVLVKIIGE